MTSDWHDQSVCMFITDYVIQPKESTIGFGYLQGLPDLWMRQDDSSPTRQAVSAMALTILAHRSSSFDYFVPEARLRYGYAMHSLARALQDPKEWKRDHILATIFCLGVYEASLSLNNIPSPLIVV